MFISRQYRKLCYNPVFDSQNEGKASKRLGTGNFEAFQDFPDTRYIKGFSSQSKYFS